MGEFDACRDSTYCQCRVVCRVLGRRFVALIVLVPMYAYAGLTIYLVWRNARKLSETEAGLQQEAERQRTFNDQEMRAWDALIERDQFNGVERQRELEEVDKPEDPEGGTASSL